MRPTARPATASPAGRHRQGLAAGDFNGDDISDLVAGAPGENVGATVNAGAANLFSNTDGSGLADESHQTLLQGNPEPDDRFGTALGL